MAQGDSIGVLAPLPTTFGFRYAFTATLGAFPTTYTLKVSGSAGGASASIHAFQAPDNSTLLQCDSVVAMVNQTVRRQSAPHSLF